MWNPLTDSVSMMADWNATQVDSLLPASHLSSSPVMLAGGTPAGSGSFQTVPVRSFIDTNETTYIYIDNPKDMIDPFHSNQDFMTIVLTHAITFIVGVIGNSVVIATWARGGKIRSPTATFLVSLACADLLLLIIFMPLETLEYFVITWDRHGHICKLSSFVELLSGMSTILNLVAVSVERFLVIVYPIQARRWCTVTKSRRSLIFVWLLAVIFAAPPVFNKSTYSMTYYNNETQITAYYCFEKSDSWAIYFAIYELMTLFVIPAMLMVFCYFRVIRELWTSTRVITILTSSTNSLNVSAQNAIRLNKEQSRSYLVRWPTKKLVSISVNCETSSSSSSDGVAAFNGKRRKSSHRHTTPAPFPSPNVSFCQEEESTIAKPESPISKAPVKGSVSRSSLFKIFYCIRSLCSGNPGCFMSKPKNTRYSQHHRCRHQRQPNRFPDRNHNPHPLAKCGKCSTCLIPGLDPELSSSSFAQYSSVQLPPSVSISTPNDESVPNSGCVQRLFLCCRPTTPEVQQKIQLSSTNTTAATASNTTPSNVKSQFELQNSPNPFHYLNLEAPNLTMTSSFNNSMPHVASEPGSSSMAANKLSDVKLIRSNSCATTAQLSTGIVPIGSPVNPLRYKAPVTNVRNARRQLYCQVIKMLLFIVILFHICWGPRLIFNVIKSTGIGYFSNFAYSARVYFYLLSFIHSALNPFVYGFMSSNFRRMMLNSCHNHHHRHKNQWQCQATTANNSLADAMATTSCLNMARLKASLTNVNSNRNSSFTGSDIFYEHTSAVFHSQPASSFSNQEEKCSQPRASSSSNGNCGVHKLESEDETSYSQIENEINQIVDSMQKSKQCHSSSSIVKAKRKKNFRKLFDQSKKLDRSSSLFAFKRQHRKSESQPQPSKPNANSITSLPKFNFEHSY